MMKTTMYVTFVTVVKIKFGSMLKGNFLKVIYTNKSI